MPGQEHTIDECLDGMAAGAQDEREGYTQDGGTAAGSVPTLCDTVEHGIMVVGKSGIGNGKRGKKGGMRAGGGHFFRLQAGDNFVEYRHEKAIDRDTGL